MIKKILSVTAVIGSVFAVSLALSFAHPLSLQFPSAKVIDAKVYTSLNTINNESGNNTAPSREFNYYNEEFGNVNLKNAIMGDPSINNGNYVVIIGSEAQVNYLQLMYGQNTNGAIDSNILSPDNFLNNRSTVALNGSIGQAMNLVFNKNDNTYFEAYNEFAPEFIIYQDTLDSQVLKNRAEFIERKDAAIASGSLDDGSEEEEANKFDTNAEWSFNWDETFTNEEGEQEKFRDDDSAKDYLKVIDFVNKYWGITVASDFPTVMMFTEENVHSPSAETNILEVSRGATEETPPTDGGGETPPPPPTDGGSLPMSHKNTSYDISTFADEDVPPPTDDGSGDSGSAPADLNAYDISGLNSFAKKFNEVYVTTNLTTWSFIEYLTLATKPEA